MTTKESKEEKWEMLKDELNRVEEFFNLFNTAQESLVRIKEGKPGFAYDLLGRLVALQDKLITAKLAMERVVVSLK